MPNLSEKYEDPGPSPSYRVFGLQVPIELAEQFDAIQLALNHDEPEETFTKLVELGLKAISLTGKDNPKLWMFTRKLNSPTTAEIACPNCKHQFFPNSRQQNDDYREVLVNLI